MRYAGRPVGIGILAAGITLTVLGIGAGKVYGDHVTQPPCTGTYVQDVDNIGNGGVGPADNDMDKPIMNLDSNHPIEFNINANQTGSYTLTIKAYDVGTSVPDKVNFNGAYLGNLTGNGGTWSDSSFPVTISSTGNQLVEIIIDNNDGAGADAIEVGCGILNAQSVGGFAEPPLIGAYPLNEKDSTGFSGKEIGLIAGSAAAGALALGGAGYYMRRNRD
jgi:hypothetical protein